jgi:hypothetical protein
VALTFDALPPLAGAGYVRVRLGEKLDNDTSARFANSAGIASEAVRAVRTVASLAMEREIVEVGGHEELVERRGSIMGCVLHSRWTSRL